MLALAGCLLTFAAPGPARAQESQTDTPPRPHESRSGTPARTEPRAGRVALTFDDGPDPVWTPVILDVLDTYDIKATFFVNGMRVAEYPEVAREVLRRGHSLQNHGYGHHLMTSLGETDVRREIVRSAETIARQTGVTPACFRPPYGKFDDRTAAIAAEAGEEIVLWTVDSADYFYQSAAEEIQQTLRDLHEGDVILMHDRFGESLRQALPVIIEAVRAAGLDFDTLCDESRARRQTGLHERWGRFHRFVE